MTRPRFKNLACANRSEFLARGCQLAGLVLPRLTDIQMPRHLSHLLVLSSAGIELTMLDSSLSGGFMLFLHGFFSANIFVDLG